MTIVDFQTLQIEHFTYDGTAPLVYFYLGASENDIDFENGLQLDPLLDRAYNNESLLITLPKGQSLDGYNAISVWCAAVNFNFSSATFVEPIPPPVPALSEWAVVVLGLLLLTAGTIVSRRRHPAGSDGRR